MSIQKHIPQIPRIPSQQAVYKSSEAMQKSNPLEQKRAIEQPRPAHLSITTESALKQRINIQLLHDVPEESKETLAISTYEKLKSIKLKKKDGQTARNLASEKSKTEVEELEKKPKQDNTAQMECWDTWNSWDSWNTWSNGGSWSNWDNWNSFAQTYTAIDKGLPSTLEQKPNTSSHHEN